MRVEFPAKSRAGVPRLRQALAAAIELLVPIGLVLTMLKKMGWQNSSPILRILRFPLTISSINRHRLCEQIEQRPLAWRATRRNGEMGK